MFIKNVIAIDIDDIGNLEDLLKLVFIDEKSLNFKVVIAGRDLTRNIDQKKTSDILQAYRSSFYRSSLSDKRCRRG